MPRVQTKPLPLIWLFCLDLPTDLALEFADLLGAFWFAFAAYCDRSLLSGFCTIPERRGYLDGTSTTSSSELLGGSDLYLNLGLTTSFHFEAEIKKAMIESSKQRILVTDSSKFGKISSIFFANLEEIDIIITDSEISDKYKKIIESKKIKLYIVWYLER